MKLNAEDIAALEAYAGSEYRYINGCLRGDTPCDDRIRAMIAAIDRAIAGSKLPSDRILYRGVGGDAARMIRTSGVGIGSTLSDAAFMSTSTDPDAAGLFTPPPPGGLMLRIRAPAGADALDMSPYTYIQTNESSCCRVIACSGYWAIRAGTRSSTQRY